MLEINTPTLNQEKNLLNAAVYQYNTLSDGVKKIYTNDDELIQYGNRGILDPNDVSYFGLFINGVLQPKVNYEIQKGLLLLKTEDVPIKDSSIIISFITFEDKSTKPTKLNSALVEGILPSGVISNGPVSDIDICVQDNINNYLHLESTLLCGPACIPSGCTGIWDFTLTISNVSDIPITDIIIKDTILLDLITDIKNTYVSCGSILIQDGIITWNIDTINPCEYATANFRVQGLFQAKGTRCIDRNMAYGNTVLGPVNTDIICINPINVSQGLELTQTITSGPTKVNVNTCHTWRVELKISNLSVNTVSNILIRDILFIDHTKCIKIISISHGEAYISGNEILWKIDVLKESDVSVLIVDIIGCFCLKGHKSLGIALGAGCVDTKEIFSNLSQDFQIVVSPDANTVKKQLLLQTHVLNKYMITLSSCTKKWAFSLSITNTDDKIMRNLTVIDYILLDEFNNITIKSITSGIISVSDNSVIWKIDELSPCETLTVIIEVDGLFNAAGCRSLSRAIAGESGSDSCIISDITSACPVKVLKTSCILSDKVLSLCEHTVSFENMSVDIEMHRLCKILFKPGFIMKNTLNITDAGNSPNLKRVQFLLKIPIEVTAENKNIRKCYLSDAAAIDVIMSIPTSEKEFSFDIEVETHSSISNAAFISNTNLNFSTHVFMIIRAVSKVQQFTSYLDYSEPFVCSRPTINCICNTSRLNICPKFCLLENLLSIHNMSPVIHRNNNCSDIFGDLTIEKYIVSGPLEVNANQINTWRVEIRISNYGHGPINNVIITDSLLLDELTCFNPISFTKGTISQKNNIITWDVGTLNSKNTVVLLAEITGSFYKKNNKILNVSDYQYNTVSNGIKKEFTDTDELLIYGDYGIPDPNKVSFFNLFINGVLQPEPNYHVETGLLTLTIAEPPKKNVPIILEYLVIKDDDNQLLKAETYQYNTLSNGEKTYTDADELTVYGDQGILDPNQTSYNHLFVNGVIQPGINYTIEPGILTLTVEYAPIEESPILVKFISLYL